MYGVINFNLLLNDWRKEVVGGQHLPRDVRARRRNAMRGDVVQQQQDMAPFALHSLVEPVSAFVISIF